MDIQGNLEKTRESQGKVREFENMAGSLQMIYLFCSRGKRMYILMR